MHNTQGSAGASRSDPHQLTAAQPWPAASHAHATEKDQHASIQLSSQVALSIRTLLDAASGRVEVTLDPQSLDEMRDSAELVATFAQSHPVYGRTTGVGANRSIDIDEDGRREHDRRILRSHATANGEPLTTEQVRALIIVRMNQLLRGGSGLPPQVVTALKVLLDSPTLPHVHSRGSLGTGDLNALAQLGLTLMGEKPSSTAIAVALWSPAGGEALPFISSNALTIAQAACAVDELELLLGHSAFVAAASLVAVHGSDQPFQATVHAARQLPGQQEAAAAVRAALQGIDPPAVRVQDSFGFRALPQVMAPLYAAVADVKEIVEIELNAAAENPLIVTPGGSAAGIVAFEDAVLHNGNFHAQSLALAVDRVRLALVGAAQLSLARIVNLNNPEMTGRQAFLSDDIPGSGGTMVVEYVAAAAISRLRAQAMPVTIGTTVVSRGTEDHASFAQTAIEQLRLATGSMISVLACEITCAHRAIAAPPVIDIPRESALHSYLGFFDSPGPLHDRPLSDDITQAESVLASTHAPQPEDITPE